MFSMEGGRKAQSAMEYLMTYGWAIIVILVVLAALYVLNVFSPNGILGNQCNVYFKYSCTGLTLSTNGSISLLLGQNTGANQYNVAVACTAVTNSTGGPLPANAWVYLNASGVPKSSYNSGSTYELDSGTSVQVNDTPCYGTTGATLGTQNLGTAFSGTLWERYTTQPGPVNSTNIWVLERFANIYVTIGRSGGAGTSATTSTGSTSTSITTTTVSLGTFLTGSNSSGGSEMLAGTFTGYVCSGSVFSPPASTNYSIDIEDGFSNTTAIGRGTHTCTISSSCAACKLSASDMAAVGLTDAPTPIVFPAPVVYTGVAVGPVGTLNYTISGANSFVIITTACGEGDTCSLQLPSGCTQRRDAVDPYGDSSLIATCQSQPNGKYYVNVSYTTTQAAAAACATKPYPGEPLGKCNSISMAAYVYPNYTPTGS